MFFIRLSQYGQIAWKTNGHTNYLKLDHFTSLCGGGITPVLRFDTYDDAVDYCKSFNDQFKNSTCRVVFFDDPFVQEWVKENSLFYVSVGEDILTLSELERRNENGKQ